MRVSDSRQRRTKLLILHTHPIQYYAPLFRSLARRERIEVKVVYLTDAGAFCHDEPLFGRNVQWDIPLLDGYNYNVLQPGTPITNRTFWQRHDAKLADVLAQEQPDWILLYGYASRMNWHALYWGLRHGVRLAYTSDSNARLMRGGWRKHAKQALLGRYFKHFHAFLCPSDANRDYLLAFGVKAALIHWCPFAIDYERFRSASPPTSVDRVDFVWAGKMLSLKRPCDFVNALAELVRRGHTAVRALIVGSGPLLDQVREMVRITLPMNVVHFSGFVNQSQIPTKLLSGPVFVFTSEGDSYGLAATEAAACGAALVVADINGCVGVTASAQPGINTLVYPVRNVKALADCMESLLNDPKLLNRMQRASRVIASQHDVSAASAIIESLIHLNNA